MTDHFGNLKEREKMAHAQAFAALGNQTLQEVEADIPNMSDSERADALVKVKAAQAKFNKLAKPVSRIHKAVGQDSKDIDSAIAYYDKVRRKLGDRVDGGTTEHTEAVLIQTDRVFDAGLQENFNKDTLPSGLSYMTSKYQVTRDEVNTPKYAKSATFEHGNSSVTIVDENGRMDVARKKAERNIAKKVFGLFGAAKPKIYTIARMVRDNVFTVEEANAAFDSEVSRLFDIETTQQKSQLALVIQSAVRADPISSRVQKFKQSLNGE